MNIVLLAHGIPPTSMGGTEIYAFDFANALASFGHIVTLVAPGPVVEPTYRKPVGGVRPLLVPADGGGRHHPTARYRNENFEWTLSSILPDLNPDVVHVHHLQDLGVEVLPIIARSGATTAVTLQDYHLFCEEIHVYEYWRKRICHDSRKGARCVDCFLHRYYPGVRLAPIRRKEVAAYERRRIERTLTALSEIDLLFASSAYCRSRFIKEAPWLADKIAVSHLGVRLTEGRRPSARKRRDRLRAGFLGGESHLKGFDTMVAALAQAPDWDLGIAGPVGEEGRRLIARHPGLEERITFLGPVPHEKIGEFFSSVDLLLLPSNSDNYPLAVLESFYYGVPVVASKVGGVPEQIVHGVNGFLVSPGSPAELAERLTSLADDPAILDAVRKGVHPPKTLLEHAHETEAAYRSILPRKRSFSSRPIAAPPWILRSHYWEAAAAFSDGGWREAETTARMALTLDPRHRPTLRIRAIASVRLAEDMRRNGYAHDAYTHLAWLRAHGGTRGLDQTTRFMVWYALGSVAASAGENKEALSWYRRILSPGAAAAPSVYLQGARYHVARLIADRSPGKAVVCLDECLALGEHAAARNLRDALAKRADHD